MLAQNDEAGMKEFDRTSKDNAVFIISVTIRESIPMGLTLVGMDLPKATSCLAKA